MIIGTAWPAPHRLGRELATAREERLVDLAVGVFREDRPRRGEGADGTTAVAQRQVRAAAAVVVLHQVLGPVEERLAGRARAEHLRQVLRAEEVPEPVLGVARDPTVAQGDVAARVDRRELVRAVRLPDAGQARLAPRERVEERVERRQLHAAVEALLHPHVEQVEQEPRERLRAQGVAARARPAGKRQVHLQVVDAGLLRVEGEEVARARLPGCPRGARR